MESWFEQHYTSLAELASLGLQHKALRRAEPALKKYTDYWTAPSPPDLKAEKRVFYLVEQIKIDFVEYLRDGRDENLSLQSMYVPYYRWGLSLGGFSKGIVYFPGYENKDRPSNEYSTYVYLNKPGWFIKIDDTR